LTVSFIRNGFFSSFDLMFSIKDIMV